MKILKMNYLEEDFEDEYYYEEEFEDEDYLDEDFEDDIIMKKNLKMKR
jgi:hypothetical protein